MVRIYASGKESECTEVSRIQFKMLIDETGQEYLLMYFGSSILDCHRTRERRMAEFYL